MKPTPKSTSQTKSIFRPCSNAQDSIELEDFTTENSKDIIKLIFFKNNNEILHIQCFLKESLKGLILQQQNEKHTINKIRFYTVKALGPGGSEVNVHEKLYKQLQTLLKKNHDTPELHFIPGIIRDRITKRTERFYHDSDYGKLHIPHGTTQVTSEYISNFLVRTRRS